ncbi:MAG: tetratricopeptide repeat protein [Pseudomonas sp.]
MKAGAKRAASDIEQHRRAIRVNPRNAQAHALLGLALQKVGQIEAAIASQRRALELDPSMQGLHAVMAPALFVLGQYQAAADSYRRALTAQQEDAELHKGLSDALRNLGQFDAALVSARQAVALCPDDVEHHLSLAAGLHAAGDYQGAVDSFRHVLALVPDYVEASFDLAQTLSLLRQHEAAADSYRRVLELRPDHFRAHAALGACLRELKQLDGAVASFQRALEIEPDNAAVLHDFGVSLQQLGKLAPAGAALQRAFDIAPDNATFLISLAYNCFERGEWEQTLQYNRQILQLGPPSAAAHSAALFMLSHCCDDPTELTAAHRKWGELWETPHRAGWTAHTNGRDPERQLRVGFVSADLYHHAVARFIEPVFTQLKHSTQLTLYVYYSNSVDDSMTQWLRDGIVHWYPVADLDEDALDRQIRADGIDILIDLSGHSARNRLPLFARKPAPLQASWIGYAGTTGMEAVDYYLSDQFHLPEGRYDDQFTEQIMRLPLGTPFAPDPQSPPVTPLPALTNGYLTFGSFHRANKLSRNVIALWAQLLHRMPSSKMLLGGLREGDDATLQDWFAAEGIDPSRLIMRQRTSMPKYLAQHHEVDICLSPFPYTGSTTLLHALWMGVPTLTTIGPTNPSHSVVCALAHLGLSSFIADDEPNYVALGVFLSENLTVLAQLRATMRERFTSSLFGYPGVTAASLEYGLRLMWQRWCAGLPPAPLRVRLADLVPAGAEQPAGEQ